MPIVETLKRTFEQVTGYAKPSPREARKAVQPVEPEQFLFADDGAIPNNPTLPFLVYRNAVALHGGHDPAAVFEELFAANGWGQSWRNGIYDYVHYHSKIHEVLGIARGSGRIRFGGRHGAELELTAGDVAVLPAGTGHQRLEASGDFLVVGAYPAEGEYDEYRGAPEEHARARLSIPKVARPDKDPVSGRDGALRKLWRG
jgi:uncharacterized protein YjlB